MENITLVFVHGYSVTNLDTYGELPIRLRNKGMNNGLDINIEEIFLGRYISFNDEVKLNDISRAFQTAIEDQLSEVLIKNERFICITHSTGGPVIRNWWNSYYFNKTDRICPMSHLIMMAPANFGSALAQLGKSKLSRIVSWCDGVETGQGVLDWLELGSNQAWELNMEWIKSDGLQIAQNGIFPFVITGQSIDRKLYDHLNSYTGELGSDGVIRSAAANLNSRYIKLIQETNESGESTLVVKEFKNAPVTAFRIVHDKSHSGDVMGIMKSVKKEITDLDSTETVNVIFDCIKVNDIQSYEAIVKKFSDETEKVQKDELVETDNVFFTQRYFIHDRFTQVIFRIIDSEGYVVTDYDLIFTAGKESNPNHLPEGFFIDRQQNHINKETITYYLNYDVINGTIAVKNKQGKILRRENKGISLLGLEIQPRPKEGFVRYQPCKILANQDIYDYALQPNSSTLIELELQRFISKEVFRLEKIVNNSMPTKQQGDFKEVKPGDEIVS